MFLEPVSRIHKADRLNPSPRLNVPDGSEQAAETLSYRPT